MASPSIRPIISIDGIGKSFGALKVLDDLSMRVMPGEKLALIGPSGSGKTTILRILMTLERIEAGHIEIDGEQLYHMPGKGGLVPADERHLARMRQKIGMVFQLFNLFPHKSVIDNVTLAPILTKKTPRAAAEKARQAEEVKKQQQQLVAQAVELEKIKTALDKYKSDADRQFKYYDAVLSAEIEEAKIAGQATVDLLRAKAAAEQANPAKDAAVSIGNAKKRASDTSDPNYGGKGVTFDPAIETELGPRPPGAQLDRINPEGGYEPGNVRWSTDRGPGA